MELITELFRFLKNKELDSPQELPKSDKLRAGIVPYFRSKDGEIKFLFMVSSNPKFGGDKPSIAKGGGKSGENPQEIGFREGQEELGLQKENTINGTLKLGWKGTIKGLKEEYKFFVYIVEVKSDDLQKDFNKPDFEVGNRLWYSLDEYKIHGRKSHVSIIEKIASKIK